MTDNRKFTLPSVDRLLRNENCEPLLQEYGHDLVRDALREAIAKARNNIVQGGSAPGVTEILELTISGLQVHAVPRLRQIFNLTGTVLHTNLGRSLLPQEAIDAMAMVASQPSNLEFETATGMRGDRDSLLEGLLCELTGAEAATVVNNNAAAVFLVLNSLAQGQQVPVSRGELVEIGGSFRVPDIMSRSGCELVEIGTTNRTHSKDYKQAISDNTALLMKVHTSNYEIQGFTASVSDQNVAKIAFEHQLPFITDLGSGTLVDLRKFGLPYEPTVRESIEHGADLVTFSGDKLLGGPQAGLIVGKKELIKTIKANPLKRALRVDKMTIAALQEVLKLYRNPKQLTQKLPTLRLLARPLVEISEIAELIKPPLESTFGAAYEVDVVDCMSQIGSGSLPVEQLASKAILLKPKKHKGVGKQLQQISAGLRSLPCPVIGRITDDTLVLDVRCLENTTQFLDQLKLLDKLELS